MIDRKIQELMEELGAKSDSQGLAGLRETEQVAVVAWSARGIIGNGGFKYFYEGSVEMAHVARAFRELGFPGAAAACERIDASIPAAARPGGDAAARGSVLPGFDWQRFDADEDAIVDVSWEDLGHAIGKHLGQNG